MSDDTDHFKIEDGIEIPAHRSTAGGSRYPLTRLRPKQSFFVPEPKDGGKRALDGISSTIRATARRHNIAIETRKVVETFKGKETKGIRVWRVADRHPGASK